MIKLLRVPVISIENYGYTEEYTVSSSATSIDITSIEAVELYDKHTGRTVNKYMVLHSGMPYNKCRKCAFAIDRKDRIAGVCSISNCRNTDRIFVSTDNLLEEL